MSDQNVTSVPPQPPAVPLPPEPAKLEYQPVSIWAVFGFLAGGSVAAIVVGTLFYAFATAATIQVPAWLIFVLSLSGTVLSFIGLRQIVTSEGTRTGMRLARWGLWLSILTGAGFFVFNLSTRLVLQSQANTFIMQKLPDDDGKKVPDSGFIPRLLEGCKGDQVQFNCAFLLTLPERGGDDPRDQNAINNKYVGAGKDKAVGYLTRFKENSMVRFLRETMLFMATEDLDKVQIEPQGVLQCDFESPKGKGRGYYKVVRNYQVTTPEYIKLYSIEALSMEGERRKWRVGLPVEQEQAARFTRLGYGMKGLRLSVHKYLREWSSNGVRGLRNIDKTNYEELGKTESSAEQMRRAVDEIDGPAGAEIKQLHILSNVDVTPWEKVGGKIRISYPVTMKILVGSPQVGRELKGYITVESEADVDPETYTLDSPSPVWKFPTLKWVTVDSFELPSKQDDGKSKGKGK